MNTPICDFVDRYLSREAVRLHMPGHKGVVRLGGEPRDITEISGADDLSHATGIIHESEENAARLFGTQRTLYSTEGSSLCIRAMLLLAKLWAESRGEQPRILAGRNAHKSFLSAAALLRIDVDWLFSSEEGLLSCRIDHGECERLLEKTKATALYVTSPDYLGNRADIETLSALCHKHGAILLVDNAHGAYLKFLEKSQHPIDGGADLVCDSAHKTLPVLTGGAYLHISKNAPMLLASEAENALSLFASTSPSYLILQSLDMANRLLAGDLPRKTARVAARAAMLKTKLATLGLSLVGDEPLKLTVAPKDYGYTGHELSEYLEKNNIVCEFCDEDFLVLMLSSETSENDFLRLEAALKGLPKKPPITKRPPRMTRPTPLLSPAKALLAVSELIPITQAEGKILAAPSVACPPAVPILVSGERIDADAIRLFSYYGIKTCRTVKTDVYKNKKGKEINP